MPDRGQVRRNGDAASLDSPVHAANAQAHGLRPNANGGAGAGFTIDPMPNLAPVAARILAAAQQLLVEKGLGGLTLKAIAETSGENSAMVQYYFHGKAGLIDAMITSIVHDDSIEVASIMSAVTGDDLLPKFVGGLQRISVSKSFRVFFDVLPYALRHEHFRRHMAEVYEWYRHIKLEWLGAEHGEAPPASYDLLGLAELIVAVVDGLAVQHALDDDFDLSRPYAVLEKILHRVLPEMLAEGEASEPTPSSDQPPSSPSSRAQFLATLARTTLTRPPS